VFDNDIEHPPEFTAAFLERMDSSSHEPRVPRDELHSVFHVPEKTYQRVRQSSFERLLLTFSPSWDILYTYLKARSVYCFAYERI